MLKIDLTTLPLPDHNNEIRINCPECITRKGTPDKKKHLYISVSKGVHNCFRCGYSGRVDFNKEFKVKHTNQSFSLEDCPPEKLPSNMISLREAVDFYPEVAHFVMERKLPIHLHPTWGYLPKLNDIVDGIVTSGIIVPLFFNDKYQGFVIRFVNPRYGYKWKFSKNIHVKDFLYNYDSIKGGECYVVEGVFDTLTLPESSVASFGKSLSDRQMELLSSRFTKVTMLYDGDALHQSLEYAIKLHKFIYEVYVVRLDKHKDPFDYTREELLALPRRHVLEECLITDMKLTA